MNYNSKDGAAYVFKYAKYSLQGFEYRGGHFKFFAVFEKTVIDSSNLKELSNLLPTNAWSVMKEFGPDQQEIRSQLFSLSNNVEVSRVQIYFQPGWFSPDQLHEDIMAEFLDQERLRLMLPASWLKSDVLWRGDVGVLRMGDNWVRHLCLQARCSICGGGDSEKIAG